MPGYRVLVILACVVGICSCQRLEAAQLFSFSAASSGWYTEDGKHNPGNENYLVGDDGDDGLETRNYFIFDLAQLVVPAGKTVVSASLSLDTYTYLSPYPTEDYALFDVSTPATALDSDTLNIATYADLGTGVSFGVRTYSAADTGFVRTINLTPAAFVAIRQAAGGQFAIGGRITTLDGQRATGLETDEIIFGFSELGVRRLDVVVDVPEPGGWMMLGMIVALCGVRRRSRRIRAEWVFRPFGA